MTRRYLLYMLLALPAIAADKDDRLDMVLLQSIGDTTDFNYQTLQNLLVEKYGRPWESQARGTTELQWTLKTTVIKLSRVRLPLTTNRLVSVQYRRRKD